MTGRRLNTIDKAVYVRLRVERLERGISQGELAARAGVSHQQYQKYEAGKDRIAIGRLDDICQALEMSLLQFMGLIYDAAGSPVPQMVLTKRQKSMLKLFNGLPPREQDEVLNLLRYKKRRTD